MRLLPALSALCALGLTTACGGGDATTTIDTSGAVSERPVRLAERDAAGAGCRTSGTLSAESEVKAYPDSAAGDTASLPAGTPVWICERYGASTWYGVLYDGAENIEENIEMAADTTEATDENGAEEASEAEEETTPTLPQCGLVDTARNDVYDGACASGWVLAERVSLDREDDA